MTTSTKDEITMSAGTAPAAAPAPAAPATPAGPSKIEGAQPPADVRERAGMTGKNLLKRFKASTEKRFADRQKALEGRRRAGRAHRRTVRGLRPVRFHPDSVRRPPPYQPSKIDFIQDQFGAPATDFNLLEFWFQAPYPGYKPQLFEANLSADVLNFGQPYAAFASTIIDADTWKVQENIPLRYLVYPK